MRDPNLPPVRAADVKRILIVGSQVATDAEGLARRSGREPTPIFVMPAAELPDSMPPFLMGSVRVDVEGRLWVGTPESTESGSVYHVLDGQGKLIARVAVPRGRTIVGFGRNGVVYMAVNADGAAYLERAMFGLQP
jgi:hypothetical protein